jgi:protein involved in polysaccharide export with SLBB domain
MKKIKYAGFCCICIVLILAVACSSQNQAVKKPTTGISSPVNSTTEAYILNPGDQIDVRFFYNPELNETVLVRPDGKISLSLVDDVQAAGLRPAELDETLTKLYSKELRKPVITVIVRTFATEQIFVGGEVNNPGVVRLVRGMSPLHAVLQAGGFRETADPKEAILIRKDKNNQPIPVEIDLSAAIYGNGVASGIVLQPHDVVYIPKTAIAEANKFVRQYIEELLLFRGFSVGFGYDLNNND